MAVSFEEVRICPRCKQTGRIDSERPRRDGSKIVTIFCEVRSCRWFNTSWIIQIMPDGSIAEPKGHDKFFPEIPDQTDKVRDYVDKELRRQTGQ